MQSDQAWIALAWSTGLSSCLPFCLIVTELALRTADASYRLRHTFDEGRIHIDIIDHAQHGNEAQPLTFLQAFQTATARPEESPTGRMKRYQGKAGAFRP